MQSAVLLLLLIARTGGEPAPADRTMILAWDLLATARYGHDPKEHAAFIVEGEHGELQLSRWPWGAESMRATYRGPIPSSVVAIVHTHPGDLPHPSPGDIAAARRLGIPVYVITRTSVTVTNGSRTIRIASGDWNPHR